MHRIRSIHKRLRLPFWHRADIEAELASHLQEIIADLTAQGTARADAEKLALQRFGDVDSVADSLQEIHKNWMGGATVRKRLLWSKMSLIAVVSILAIAVLFGRDIRSYLLSRPWPASTEEMQAFVQHASQSESDLHNSTLSALVKFLQSFSPQQIDRHQREGRLLYSELTDAQQGMLLSIAKREPYLNGVDVKISYVQVIMKPTPEFEWHFVKDGRDNSYCSCFMP